MNTIRTGTTGYLLAFASGMAALGAIAWPPLLPVAGLVAWVAAAIGWRGASRRSLGQALVLTVIGSVGLAWGLARGIPIDLASILGANMGLVALLVGVSFLQLVAMPAEEGRQEQPRGPGAFRATGLGVHLFGAVINLSSVFLVGEKLRDHAPLGRTQAVLLTRYFAAAAFWSPFFAAMAAALTFAPGAKLLHLVLAGVPLALVSMAISWLETGRKVGRDFVGYPTRYRHLRLPAGLAAAVLIVHAVDPTLSVIAVIALLSPAVAALGLLRRRRHAPAAMHAHITGSMPRMVNELLLFLAAGVLAGGIGAVLASVGGWSPYTSFGPLEAWLTVATITALAVAGVHPVIGIAAFSAMVMPLEPNRTLLAMSFLVSWGLGSAVSPLSGMNLGLQGRFGLDGLLILRWNACYTVLMLIAVAPFFWAASRLFG